MLPRHILRFEAGGVHGGVRLDGGIEIAIDRLRPLGLPGQIGAQQLHLRLHVGQVRAQHLLLRLRLGQHRRELLVLIAFALERPLGGVERGERVPLRLLRLRAHAGEGGIGRGMLCAGGLELAREPARVRDGLIERGADVRQVLLGALPRLGLLAEGALGVDACGVDLGVRLDRGVEIAIRRVRAVGLLLDLLARRFQFLVEAVDDGLGFSLNFLGRDADGGARGRVEAADELLDLLIGLRRRGVRFNPFRDRVERFVKGAELLERHFGLAGKQPGEES